MKKLKFLGIGSAFYPPFDNTSAFFTHNDDFYLIDCGESVFKKIWDLKEMKESKNIFILVTHFHCDHVGSLGSLISYLYLKMNKVPYIVHPTEKIKEYLKVVGIEENFYIYKNMLPEVSQIKNNHVEVRHVDDMGLNRNMVRSSVINDLKRIGNIPVGKPVNRIINVSGDKLQYTVFKRLENGKYIYNIGRIHGI